MQGSESVGRIKKLIIVLLVTIVAVGTYQISSTYAKYTTSLSGNDSVSVARWKWTINSEDIASITKTTFDFDLFSTILDDDLTSAETSTSTGLLAPGTGGYITLDVINKSEVNGTYTVTFAESFTNLPNGITRLPIEYSLNNSTWTTDISGLSISEDLVRNDTNADIGTAGTQGFLYWRWRFDTSNDTIDTELGRAAYSGNVPTAVVTATIVFTQIDTSPANEPILTYANEDICNTLTPECEVIINEDHFYVVSSNSTETVLMAKYNLMSDGNGSYEQDTSGTKTNTVKVKYIDSSGTAYWDGCQYNDTSRACTGSSGLLSPYNNSSNAVGTTSYVSEYPYIYNSNAVNIEPVVVAYTNKIAAATGKTIVGKLITYEQANSLSESGRADKNNGYYWTGSAYSQIAPWCVSSTGRIYS